MHFHSFRYFILVLYHLDCGVNLTEMISLILSAQTSSIFGINVVCLCRSNFQNPVQSSITRIVYNWCTPLFERKLKLGGANSIAYLHQMAYLIPSGSKISIYGYPLLDGVS